MPQEQAQQVAWSQEMHEETLGATVGDDDFTKFLDLDNDFQFGGLDNGHSGLDTPMGRLGFGHSTMASMQGVNYENQAHMTMNVPHTSTATGFNNTVPTHHSFDPYQQYHQMPVGHNYQIPPTPVSAEMHGSKYAPSMDNNGHLMYDGRQVSFTPLVSPAQTPLDGGFSLQYDGMGGDEFFSPLTSPAIEAQAAYSTGTTASPIEMNGDPGSSSKPPASASKRSRRKPSVNSRTPARSVRQSPAMKPQTRRRQGSISNLPMEKIEQMLNHSNHNQSLQPHLLGSSVLPNSDDSVSPEPLSEALMRPPPIPQASSRSPALLASSQTSSTGPVTPATLMRMPSNQTLSPSVTSQTTHQNLGEQMEDIMLPDAAASGLRSHFQEIDNTKLATDDDGTPVLSAKSAKVTASSTPRSSLAKHSSQESFSKPAKIEGRGSRASKKRQSTTSATISPALRPKISPSISPLVPASGPGMSHISAETSALYLASKSNYQNILEGTHLPGVSYPETLAENLSSKRTSHKIAEQGRRNRINLALKEIESLLPPSITAGVVKKEKASSTENEDCEKTTSSANAAQGASKASTVEMAIVYIKSLQEELKMTKDKLDTAEKKLADCISSAGSQASD